MEQSDKILCISISSITILQKFKAPIVVSLTCQLLGEAASMTTVGYRKEPLFCSKGWNDTNSCIECKNHKIWPIYKFLEVLSHKKI